MAGRKGDGHVFSAATSSFVSAAVTKATPLHPTKDFTPIAVMAVDELLIVTHPNSPVKTVQDIVAASKKAPKSIRVAVTSATGSEATAVALLEMGADIQLNTIPFNSGAEVNAAILGGQVELAVSNPNELFPNIEAGKLTPVVTFGAERMSALKDTPTMVELGYKDARMHNPRGIVAAPGIPQNQKDFLINMMKQVTDSKEWKDYVDKNMMTLVFMGGDEYSKFLDEEWKMYTDVYTKMGILSSSGCQHPGEETVDRQPPPQRVVQGDDASGFRLQDRAPMPGNWDAWPALFDPRAGSSIGGQTVRKGELSLRPSRSRHRHISDAGEPRPGVLRPRDARSGVSPILGIPGSHRTGTRADCAGVPVANLPAPGLLA